MWDFCSVPQNRQIWCQFDFQFISKVFDGVKVRALQGFPFLPQQTGKIVSFSTDRLCPCRASPAEERRRTVYVCCRRHTPWYIRKSEKRVLRRQTKAPSDVWERSFKWFCSIEMCETVSDLGRGNRENNNKRKLSPDISWKYYKKWTVIHLIFMQAGRFL